MGRDRDAVVRSSGVLCCALALPIAPALGQNFTDEALARGIDYQVTNDALQFGSGLGMVDLDNDGDPDIVALGKGDGSVGLWENDGTGNFTSRLVGSGMPVLSMPSGVSAADYDNDGDLDLHFTDFNGPDKLMRNEGGFFFTDVSAVAGVDSTGVGFGCAWGDYDGDGWLDLYVPNRTTTDNNFIRNHLFRNDGDGTFTDVGEALGVTDGDAPSLVAAFLDYDRDGDADLYLGNDKGAIGPWYNHMYRNNGDGTFTDVSVATGTDADVDCMGIAWGDFNRDRHMDIYVTNISLGNVLLINQGDSTFADQTASAGVSSNVVSWGTQFLDYDHDMHMDLFMTNTIGPNRMYRHDGIFPCVDMAPALGLQDVNFSYVFAMGDVDLDGDLDLLTQAHNQKLRLFINNASDGAWVKLRVVGQGNNGFAVGATIEANTGGIWQTREVQMGNNYKAQNDHLQHIGLGSFSHIDELVVTWPGGTTRTLTGYAANQTWTIYPPERLGDGDGDGDVDHRDYRLAIESCFGAGALSPGCEVFDMDGDGDVDLVDIQTIAELVYTGSDRRLPAFRVGG